jgi:hypothetical protein
MNPSAASAKHAATEKSSDVQRRFHWLFEGANRQAVFQPNKTLGFRELAIRGRSTKVNRTTLQRYGGHKPEAASTDPFQLANAPQVPGILLRNNAHAVFSLPVSRNWRSSQSHGPMLSSPSVDCEVF